MEESALPPKEESPKVITGNHIGKFTFDYNTFI